MLFLRLLQSLLLAWTNSVDNISGFTRPGSKWLVSKKAGCCHLSWVCLYSSTCWRPSQSTRWHIMNMKSDWVPSIPSFSVRRKTYDYKAFCIVTRVYLQLRDQLLFLRGWGWRNLAMTTARKSSLPLNLAHWNQTLARVFVWFNLTNICPKFTFWTILYHTILTGHGDKRTWMTFVSVQVIRQE